MKIYRLSGEPGSKGWENADRGRENPKNRGKFACPQCQVIADIINPRGEIDCSHCGHSWNPLQGVR
jgi:hypothetical protein